MAQITQSELASMLHGSGAEKFRVEGGREFDAVYNAPTVTDNEYRGFDPTVTAVETDVADVKRDAIVWRVDPVQRFRVTGRSPLGNGTFIDLHLRLETA